MVYINYLLYVGYFMITTEQGVREMDHAIYMTHVVDRIIPTMPSESLTSFCFWLGEEGLYVGM